MKKILLIFVFIAISGCGFNPIYSQNDKSVINQIYKIEKKGDSLINRKILNNLNISSNNNKSNYLFEINSNYLKKGSQKIKPTI